MIEDLIGALIHVQLDKKAIFANEDVQRIERLHLFYGVGAEK